MIVSVIVEHLLLSFLLSALFFGVFLHFLTIMIVRTNIYFVTIRITIILAAIFSNDLPILISNSSYVAFTSDHRRFSIWRENAYLIVCNSMYMSHWSDEHAPL